MSDIHLRILRAAAGVRARQLRADEPQADQPKADARGDAAHRRHVELQRLAAGARRQLDAASARRRRPGG
jgi:hypothetical protein